MIYVPEIWVAQAEKYTRMMKNAMGPLGLNGCKPVKGEKVVPLELLFEVARDAYRQGAESALRMAAELDANDVDDNDGKYKQP